MPADQREDRLRQKREKQEMLDRWQSEMAKHEPMSAGYWQAMWDYRLPGTGKRAAIMLLTLAVLIFASFKLVSGGCGGDSASSGPAPPAEMQQSAADQQQTGSDALPADDCVQNNMGARICGEAQIRNYCYELQDSLNRLRTAGAMNGTPPSAYPPDANSQEACSAHGAPLR